VTRHPRNLSVLLKNNFRFLGVQALLGRGISPEDVKPARLVFVMAYKLWNSRFHQDPAPTSA